MLCSPDKVHEHVRCRLKVIPKTDVAGFPTSYGVTFTDSLKDWGDILRRPSFSPPPGKMASPGLNEDADAERNRANLVSFVLRPLSSRATISRYLLEDAGSLSLASKVVYELMVSRLPAVSPNISKMPVERLYIACRPINALTTSSWPGLARLNEILAKLPGVGAPVKLGSTEIAPANSVFGFESLTLKISFSSPPPPSQLLLGDLASSSLENISKLVLHGNVACGDVATLLPLLKAPQPGHCALPRRFRHLHWPRCSLHQRHSKEARSRRGQPQGLRAL